MSRDAITRRTLILAAAASAVSLPAGALWWPRCAAAGDLEIPAPDAFVRVARAAEARYGPESGPALRRVGGHHLTALGQAGLGEAERHATLADTVDALDGTQDAEFAAVVASRIRDDFRAGRVVDLGGWVLALTEVELCAVVALAAGPVAR